MKTKKGNLIELEKKLNFLISNNINREEMSDELKEMVYKLKIKIFLDAIFEDDNNENLNEE